MSGFFARFRERSRRDQAWAHLDARRYREAADLFAQLRETMPDDEHVLLGLGQALAETGDLAAAVEALEASTRNASAVNPVPWIALGYTEFRAGRLERATAALTKALEVDTKHPAARYYMGLVHLATGRLDEATEDFEQVASEKPTWIQARSLALSERLILDRPGERGPAMPARPFGAVTVSRRGRQERDRHR